MATLPVVVARWTRCARCALTPVLGLLALCAVGRSVAAQEPRWVQFDLPAGDHARFDSAIAYDSIAHRMLSFGGTTGVGRASDELWAFDLTAGAETWTRLSLVGTGPGALFGQAAFDTNNNRFVLLLGGARFSTWCADFSTPGGTWKKLDAPGPTGTLLGPIVYHAPTQRALMVAPLSAGKEKSGRSISPRVWRPGPRSTRVASRHWVYRGSARRSTSPTTG